MTTGTDFEKFLIDVPRELGPVCVKLRTVIAKLHPEFVEIIWPGQRIASYGLGPKKMSEHYVYIAPQTKHVNLGLYRGASARDPAGLLEGTGKRLRHTKIRSVADAQSTAVRQLIFNAIAERKKALP